MQSSQREEENYDQVFVEGLDFYFEEGLMVLTARYLRNRAICCGSDCRHCPYEGEDKKRSE